MNLALKIAGTILCLGGLAHVFSYFFAHQSPFVTWPDAHGHLLGWTLRIAVIALGGALLLIGSRANR